MNIKRLTHTHVMHGILTVLHIPLLLLIYAIKPFLKVRFGYFSTDRIGHFALDLGYAIAINQNKNKNEINLYYLQGNISNAQLKVIAKRELNISQYYKYFVYAYTMLGLGNNVIVPHRRKSSSRDTVGIMRNFTYDILLSTHENKMSELYLERYRWTKGERFICINVRDSAFANESKSEMGRHTYRNSDIDDYEAATNYLLDLGYWVVRMGKKVENPFKIRHAKLIDYAVDSDRSDLLDIWLCKNCEFFISTGTGIDSVAAMFKKQIVFVNYLPILIIISWINSITLPKRLFWENGKELSLTEHLDNSFLNTYQYKDKKIKIVNLTSDEIKCAVQEMINRLDDLCLTNKQSQDQSKFWNILENHKLYDKYHGVRDLNASFGTSFLKNNQDFLS